MLVEHDLSSLGERSFYTDGYCAVRPAVSSDQTRDIAARLNRSGETSSKLHPNAHRTAFSRDSRLLQSLYEVATTSNVLGAVSSLLGGPCAVMPGFTIHTNHQALAPGGTHVDSLFATEPVRELRPSMILGFLAVHDQRARHGALQVVPGSMYTPPSLSRHIDDCEFGLSEPDVQGMMVPLECRAGTLCLLHPSLWHQRGVVTSDPPARAVVSRPDSDAGEEIRVRYLVKFQYVRLSPAPLAQPRYVAAEDVCLSMGLSTQSDMARVASMIYRGLCSQEPHHAGDVSVDGGSDGAHLGAARWLAKAVREKNADALMPVCEDEGSPWYLRRAACQSLGLLLGGPQTPRVVDFLASLLDSSRVWPRARPGEVSGAVLAGHIIVSWNGAAVHAGESTQAGWRMRVFASLKSRLTDLFDTVPAHLVDPYRCEARHPGAAVALADACSRLVSCKTDADAFTQCMGDLLLRLSRESDQLGDGYHALEWAFRMAACRATCVEPLQHDTDVTSTGMTLVSKRSSAALWNLFCSQYPSLVAGCSTCEIENGRTPHGHESRHLLRCICTKGHRQGGAQPAADKGSELRQSMNELRVAIADGTFPTSPFKGVNIGADLRSIPTAGAVASANVTRARQPLILISGPSGVGKTSVEDWLYENCSERFHRVIAHTTRAPRPGEEDGVSYHFVDIETFSQLEDAGMFIESACNFGNMYGVTYAALMDAHGGGRVPIKNTNPSGAQGLLEKLHSTGPQTAAHQSQAAAIHGGDTAEWDVCCVFLLPPSESELYSRLAGRGNEDQSSLKRKMEVNVDKVEAAKVMWCWDAAITIRTGMVAEAARELAELARTFYSLT